MIHESIFLLDQTLLDQTIHEQRYRQLQQLQ